MPRRKVAAPKIVLLSEARLARRLAVYRERLDRVLRHNRRALGRLYTTGTLFTKVGTRAGRDLLLAHEHLLRVVALLDQLSHQGDVPAPKKQSDVDAIFKELDTLLEQTATLTTQTNELLGELKKE